MITHHQSDNLENHQVTAFHAAYSLTKGKPQYKDAHSNSEKIQGALSTANNQLKVELNSPTKGNLTHSNIKSTPSLLIIVPNGL